MTAATTYRCDLCGDTIETTNNGELIAGVGFHPSPGEDIWYVLEETPGARKHICYLCYVAIQSGPQRCSEGFDCPGGINCGSDHK